MIICFIIKMHCKRLLQMPEKKPLQIITKSYAHYEYTLPFLCGMCSIHVNSDHVTEQDLLTPIQIETTRRSGLRSEVYEEIAEQLFFAFVENISEKGNCTCVNLKCKHLI